MYLKQVVVVLLSLMVAVKAVDYAVVDNTGDTAGGKRFREEIGGESYGTQTLSTATDFVWRLFQQDNTPSERRSVSKITLFIDNGNGVAYNTNSGTEIHVNAGYLAGFSGDVRREFTGVVYHEVVHSWQWNGENQAPGLTEGIADYVRLKAGFAPGHWVEPGRGDKWDQGYDVTARFLDYCNDLRNGFVAELNKKMRTGYSESFFVELLGKDVNQLWSEYKAKYGQ